MNDCIVTSIFSDRAKKYSPPQFFLYKKTDLEVQLLASPKKKVLIMFSSHCGLAVDRQTGRRARKQERKNAIKSVFLNSIWLNVLLMQYRS